MRCCYDDCCVVVAVVEAADVETWSNGQVHLHLSTINHQSFQSKLRHSTQLTKVQINNHSSSIYQYQ
jgi:hypothetical protein